MSAVDDVKRLQEMADALKNAPRARGGKARLVEKMLPHKDKLLANVPPELRPLLEKKFAKLTGNGAAQHASPSTDDDAEAIKAELREQARVIVDLRNRCDRAEQRAVAAKQEAERIAAEFVTVREQHAELMQMLARQTERIAEVNAQLAGGDDHDGGTAQLPAAATSEGNNNDAGHNEGAASSP